jgi:type I restriction enzyme R subunit
MYSGFPYEDYFQADTAKKLSLILAAEEHILGLEHGKSRYINEVTALRPSLRHRHPARPSDGCEGRGVLLPSRESAPRRNSTSPDSGRSDEEIETTIRQVIDKALVSEKR